MTSVCRYQKRLLQVLGPVAGLGIEQDEAGVYLVLRLRGDIGDNDRGVACSIEGRGQVVAHQAGVATFARLRELDFGQQPVALRKKHRGDGHLQLDAELTSHPVAEWRDKHKAMRLRDGRSL